MNEYVSVDRSYYATTNAFFSSSNHMWLFTAPNTNHVFHAGPSKTAHWIDVTGSGDVIQSVVRGNIDQMCGNAIM